jgi:hypoxanthine phosphoribosyltransferase
MVEMLYNSNVGKFLILDDIVESGRTILHIKKSIEELFSNDPRVGARCVGVFLYNQSSRAPYVTRFIQRFPSLPVKAHLTGGV